MTSNLSNRVNGIMDRKQRYWSFFILIALFAVVQLRATSGTSSGIISYGMDDKAVAVTGSTGTTAAVYLKDILSVEYVEGLEIGEALEAVQERGISCGKFQNAVYGVYSLYAYDKNTTYVVVKHADGVLVFNDKDSNATAKIYEELKAVAGE